MKIVKIIIGLLFFVFMFFISLSITNKKAKELKDYLTKAKKECVSFECYKTVVDRLAEESPMRLRIVASLQREIYSCQYDSTLTGVSYDECAKNRMSKFLDSL